MNTKENHETLSLTSMKIAGVIGMPPITKSEISIRLQALIDSIPDEVLPDDAIYIDTKYSGSNSGYKGTITAPFKTLPAFENGKTYKVKRGSVIPNITFSQKTDVTISEYGDGPLAKISSTGVVHLINFQNSSNCRVIGFKVEGSNNAISLTHADNSPKCGVYGCDMSEAHHSNNNGFGLHAFYSDDFELIDNKIDNVALDGIYTKFCKRIKVTGNRFTRLNQRYFTNPNQSASSGDGIQLDGTYDGFYIAHNIIDRSDGAGNKYGLILNSAAGLSDEATGTIEHNKFISNNNVSACIHIERGNGIQVLNNEFIGSGGQQAIRLGGKFVKNTLIKGNTFRNFDRGVGVGATYPGGYPATNTIVEDNIFYNVKQYHVWVDKSKVTLKNNTHMRTTDKGIAIFNYGGGSAVIESGHYSIAGMEGSFGAGTNPTYAPINFIDPDNGNFQILKINNNLT